MVRAVGERMNENDLLEDPQASEWLRNALRTALECDPVRTANEADWLVHVLRLRVVRLAQIQAMVLDGKGDPDTGGTELSAGRARPRAGQ
jgi:hypothetical protein